MPRSRSRRRPDHRIVFNAVKSRRLYRLATYLRPFPPHEIRLVVNQRIRGSTPLVMACHMGDIPMTEFLVNHCQADIEISGSVTFDHLTTISGATPLWYAAEAGYYDIVKFLIQKGANVNTTTETLSTPLRAACYNGYFDTVLCLIASGAETETVNLQGQTCLMIASYRGHIKIVQLLLQRNVNVNVENRKGNTALYECIEAGKMAVAKLLIQNGALLTPNYHGVTPLLVASITGNAEIIRYIIDETKLPTRSEKIDALELLGATYVDKGNNLIGAYEVWKRAMELRFDSRYIPVLKTPASTIKAYGNTREILNIQELEAISGDREAMQIQALLIRERILGRANHITPHYILLRGSTYAAAERFDRCTALWLHALEMQQLEAQPLNLLTQNAIVLFLELFAGQVDRHVLSGGSGYTPAGNVTPNISFNDFMVVWRRALSEVQAGRNIHDSIGYSETIFERILGISMQLMAVLAKLLPQLTDEQRGIVHQELGVFLKLNIRGPRDSSVIHMACYNSSDVVIIHASAELPSVPLVRMLLKAGADVNARDADGNTPLHLAAMADNEMLIKVLLEAGAHFDTLNDARESFAMMWLHPVSQVEPDPMKRVTLKCLAARVLRDNNVEVNEDEIPPVVYSFIMKH